METTSTESTPSAARDNRDLRLYKKEKLCSQIAISQLFGPESRQPDNAGQIHSAIAYPLRCVWRENPRRSSDAPVQFLISVPKKRLRHAVDRVLMRRRPREAFRPLHHDHQPAEGRRIDVAFIYIANGTEPYARVARAMSRLLKAIAR